MAHLEWVIWTDKTKQFDFFYALQLALSELV